MALKVVAAFALMLSAAFLIVDLYALNKGFSLWDEAYYLLSYRMAAQGFFRHFNNTPFLVAFLFERALHPGLIGYRLIHLILNLLGSAVLSAGVIRYVRKFCARFDALSSTMVFSLAAVGAVYSYQVSVSTLSYNHLNEFFVLVSEGLMLFAVSSTSRLLRLVLVFLSGFTLAFDVYVKPPTFLSIGLAESVFIALALPTWKERLVAQATLVVGCVAAIGFSVLTFYPVVQWEQYISLMRSQQAHAPLKVLSQFLGSALEMLWSASAIILAGLGVAGWLTIDEKRYPRALLRTGRVVLITVNGCFLARFLFPSDIWTSFKVHWWYWWIYSATTMMAAALIHSAIAFCVIPRCTNSFKHAAFLVLLLLATPIGVAVGTLNGFGQVQMHAVSWLLLIGLSLTLCVKSRTTLAVLYSSFIAVALMVVMGTYFVRQEMPGNFSGGGALYEQRYRLAGFPSLHNVKVDRQMFELLTKTKAVLDRYPDVPTVSFFDLPGMQYAFGREWIVRDPWLSNYEQPLTKDDAYNCAAITAHPENLKGAIFIVSNEHGIDANLRECLEKIGFPEHMRLIGTVSTTFGGLNEPIRLYLNDQ
jgi:hypothetical protein